MLALRIYGLPAWVLLLIVPILVLLAVLGRAANKRARRRVAAAMQRDLARRGFRLTRFILSPKSRSSRARPFSRAGRPGGVLQLLVILFGGKLAGGDEAEYSVTFRNESGQKRRATAIARYDGGQIAFVWDPPLHKVLTAAEQDQVATALTDMADGSDAASALEKMGRQ